MKFPQTREREREREWKSRGETSNKTLFWLVTFHSWHSFYSENHITREVIGPTSRWLEICLSNKNEFHLFYQTVELNQLSKVSKSKCELRNFKISQG